MQMQAMVPGDIMESATPTGYEPEKHEGQSSIPEASFNFINSIVGAGIMGLPFAVNEAGFFMGLIMLVFCGLITDFSVRMLVDTALKVGCTNYEDLCSLCFGKPGFYAVSLFMFIFAFGAMVAYIVIIGDTITAVFLQFIGEGSLLTDRVFVQLLCSVCIILPVSLYKDMSSLSATSLISISSDLLLVIIICVKTITDDASSLPPPDVSAHQADQDPWAFTHAAYIEAFGAMCFAFVCQHSSFLVYCSLKNPTNYRWTLTTHVSIGVALTLCVIFSIFGYAKFQTGTKANLLNNFRVDDIAANFCRLLLALTMFFTYPMEFFVCRHSYMSTVYAGQEVTPVRHVVVSLVIWAVSVFVGVAVSDLGFVLELTGGFAATFLGFILPAACYLRVEPGSVLEMATLSHVGKLRAIFLFVFGVAAMILTTSLTLKRAIVG